MDANRSYENAQHQRQLELIRAQAAVSAALIVQMEAQASAMLEKLTQIKAIQEEQAIMLDALVELAGEYFVKHITRAKLAKKIQQIRQRQAVGKKQVLCALPMNRETPERKKRKSPLLRFRQKAKGSMAKRRQGLARCWTPSCEEPPRWRKGTTARERVCVREK